jgi:anthranilate synthase/aminodeoxychorismate synthase-like glutamine amidotransferase
MQYLQVLGCEVVVVEREVPLARVEAIAPERIVISPGPGTPQEAVRAREVTEAFAGRVPLLGICLGMQVIASVLGARVVRAPAPVHGKTSDVFHDGEALFSGLPNPLSAMRYHSLVVERDGLPEQLCVSAETADGLIMGLRHQSLAVTGVQFHPESIMTKTGMPLLANFLKLS